MIDRLWSKTPRVLFITSDTPDVATIWRTWWVCAELTAHGYIANYVRYGDLNLVLPALQMGRYNIVVTARMTCPSPSSEDEWLHLIAKLRPYVHWFYDSDDDLWSPVIVERLLATHKWPDPVWAGEQLEAQRQSRVRLAALAEGVTVSTEPLRRIADQFCSGPVSIVPNGILPDVFTAEMTGEREVAPLTIGWSGGPRLQADLEPLYEVWSAVARARPEVTFVIQGWVPPRMLEVLPAGRIRVLAGVPINVYASALSNIDIFCCVSTPDPWNLAKSPNKFFESTLAGGVCVASPEVYGSVVEHAQTGVIATTPEQWRAALLMLVDQPLLRTDLRTRAKKQVLAHHTLAQTYTHWLSAWSKVL